MGCRFGLGLATSRTRTTPVAPTTGRWRKRFSIMVHNAFSAVEPAATTCGLGFGLGLGLGLGSGLRLGLGLGLGLG